MAIENNTDYTLKGSQVLALRDYVNAAMNLPGTVIGSGAPTTTTEGNVGQFYYDTVNDKFYYCEAKTAQGTTPETYLYTWTLQASGPTVVQTTGTSTTDVMSQNAVTSMVFADPGTNQKIQIGKNASVTGSDSVAIGYGATAGSAVTHKDTVVIGRNATASGSNRVAIGAYTYAGFGYSVALGSGARTNYVGEFNIGTGVSGNHGYNSSNYRLLTGLYDPQSAHDAATKGYVDGLVGNVAAALNVINNGGNS